MALQVTDLTRSRPGSDWFARPADDLAFDLLGKRLATLIDGHLTTGRIVETEAYLPDGDTACHAVRGRTPGNQSMFDRPGRAYVYPIHSRVCFNVVCGRIDQGTAVLIRALQPLSGIDTMVGRRGRGPVRDLCRGPGRLCQALGIRRIHDGIDLSARHWGRGDRLWIDHYASPTVSRQEIRCTPRIGVTSAPELPLRFVLTGSPWASGPARLR